MDSKYQVLLFYKYIGLEDPQVVRDWQEVLCKKYGLSGRIIVAREGINITLEGTVENTERYIAELTADSRFEGIHFKRSAGTGTAFPRLSVKVRPEIVSGHLGTCDVDPNQVTGKRLAPEELHEWIKSGREFYIVDMRNAYEHAAGRFENSICPPMDHFRDLPKIVHSISHLKNKTVVTVCTGGVRCEKASGFLITQGFNDVYQLDGGIVSYMERFPNEDFLGKLYVFDGRVLMGFYTDDPQHISIGRCVRCDASSEHFINCAHDWCGKHFILCQTCTDMLGGKGKAVCPKGCAVRRPNKVQSWWQRLKIMLQAYGNR